MNRLILAVMLLFLSISLNAVERLESLAQLKKHDLIFLVYEKDGCPWCLRYKYELEDVELNYKSKIKFFKVKKGTKMSSELKKKMGLKVIIYPMTYIFKLQKNQNLQLLHEIYGYQDQSYIEELFRDKIFKK